MNIAARAIFLALLAGSAFSAAAADLSALKAAAQRAHPEVPVVAVRPTESATLFEVDFGEGRIAHVTGDGAFVIDGDLWRTRDGENVTESSRSGERAKVLAGIPRSALVQYPAATPRYHVYVFTDVDCGYCKRLHQQVEQYNAFGISVDYVLYARNGAQSDTARKHRDVLCAKDRRAALTAMKAGTPVAPGTCEAPIDALQQAGKALTMTGTPGIFAENGAVLGGYLGPADLVVRLEQNAHRSRAVAETGH